MVKKEDYMAYGYLILTFTLWGSLYVVSKLILGSVPLFTISFFRFLAAFLFLLLLSRGKTKKIDKGDYKYIVLLGVIGYFVAVGAQLLGTSYAGASMASLLNSLNPIFMYIFAVLFVMEKISSQKVISIIVCLIGVYVIVGRGEGINGLGIALSVVSVVIWSLVSVLMRKVMVKYEPVQITCYSVGIACICYLPFSVWEYQDAESIIWSGSTLVLLLYMGVICTGVGYLLWNKSLSILSPSTCSIFYPLQPVISTMLSILILKETISLSFFAGSLFITAGIFINLYERKGKVRRHV